MGKYTFVYATETILVKNMPAESFSEPMRAEMVIFEYATELVIKLHFVY